MLTFIFTPNVSRYRFVYPIEHETTPEAIAACEAAWAFYGGVFRAMVIDNMKAVGFFFSGTCDKPGANDSFCVQSPVACARTVRE